MHQARGLLLAMLVAALAACGSATGTGIQPTTPPASSTAPPSGSASLEPWPSGAPGAEGLTGRFAMVASDEAANVAVYVLDLGTGAIEGLTVPEVLPGGIAWSPDGRQLVISRTVCPPSPCATVLAILDPATGALRDLTVIQPGVVDGEPSFSPDGGRVVFMGNRAAEGDVFRTDLFTVDVDGSSLARVPLDSVTARSPSWSPDGAWIAFSDQLELQSSRLGAVRPDGTDYRVILEDPNGLGRPRWSPTGGAISFTRNGDPYEVAPGQLESALEIWVASADGTGGRPVVAHPVRGGPSAWAPGGAALAFLGGPLGEPERLWVVGLDGRALGVINVGALTVHEIAWTAAGS